MNLEKSLKARSRKGITYIGSGNYHYVSYLLLKEISKPFSLILFDHHPNLGAEAEQGQKLLSCGTWVSYALRELPLLQRVIIIGPTTAMPHQTLDPRVVIFPYDGSYQYSVKSILSAIHTDTVYISIDKDVLNRSEAVTNWDQGTMNLEMLTRNLAMILKHKQAEGIDVCGEEHISPAQTFLPDFQKIIRKNEEANIQILYHSYKRGIIVEIACRRNKKMQNKLKHNSISKAVGLGILFFLILLGFIYLLWNDGKPVKESGIHYGNQPEQTLDVYLPKEVPAKKRLPVILYAHGGGWTGGDKGNVAEKPAYFTRKGFIFVSINYRLSPKATYDQMANDIAGAVEWLIFHKDLYPIDPAKINLMGHSAGGHLMMLVGTNPKYLHRTGLSMQSIHSIVNLEGPVDLAAFIQRMGGYKKVFGNDPGVWVKASPLAYAATKNLPPMMFVTRRESAVAEFVKRSRKVGNRAKIFEASTLSHTEVTKLLGDRGASAEAKQMTDAVTAFLKEYNGRQKK